MPLNMPDPGLFDYGRKIQTEALPSGLILFVGLGLNLLLLLEIGGALLLVRKSRPCLSRYRGAVRVEPCSRPLSSRARVAYTGPACHATVARFLTNVTSDESVPLGCLIQTDPLPSGH
jgi:hypothetical protein